MIGSILVLIVFMFFAIIIMGWIRAALMFSSVCLIALSLFDGNGGLTIFGVILFLVWFVVMSASGTKTSEGQKQTQTRTKKQIQEEEKWGIIDYSEK